jgi:hypothetical protein
MMTTFDELRASPLYEQTLRTGDVGNMVPPYHTDRYFHDTQVYQAGLRLDHLIRNSLDPMFFMEFPSRKILSAIKLFLELLAEKAQTVTITEKTRDFIMERVNFCVDLIAEADRILAEHGYPPVSSDTFRQFILTGGFEPWQIVFDNPFAELGALRLGLGKDTIFYFELRNYWH